ncbi:MAG: peroxide stress protein YaaA, partial [Myxococcota bacterium]|nr:peroxide stress protein YaaA [Myxococcota bacterium]
VLTFAGDTYVGFEAGTLSDSELAFAQENIGILSGLYGLLRPLDSIQPYRLEMGTKLHTDAGQGLYRFWGETIAQEIRHRLDGHESQVVINLASKEYFSAVPVRALGCRVITPVFKEVRDGKAKVISFLAKRARGSMARYIVQNRITKPEALKEFSTDGYRFESQLSDSDEWVYVRAS